jgi:hypothetical protein
MDHLEFYNCYKNSDTVLKPLPDYDIESQVLWILTGNGYHWVELDCKFDAESWQDDATLATDYYVPHRDEMSGEGTHEGWSSCVLHGIATDKTNEWRTYGFSKEPEYNWTELGHKTKNIQSFFNNTFPAEDYARIRFMKLAAGGWISPHNDYSPLVTERNVFDWPLPINIAVDHPDNCHMTLKDQGCVPFKNGKAFLVNIFNDHSVINNSNKDRLHVIAHCYLGSRKQDFMKLIIDSYQKQHERISKEIQNLDLTS